MLSDLPEGRVDGEVGRVGGGDQHLPGAGDLADAYRLVLGDAGRRVEAIVDEWVAEDARSARERIEDPEHQVMVGLRVGLEGEPAPSDDQVPQAGLERASVARASEPGQQREATRRAECLQRPVVRVRAGTESLAAQIDHDAQPVRLAAQPRRERRARGEQAPLAGDRGGHVLRVHPELGVPNH